MIHPPEMLTPVPFYCEENIWQHLAATWASANQQAFALIVSNLQSCVPCFMQIGAPDHEALVWDYHVVALCADRDGWLVWDYNTRLALPCPTLRWLDGSFPADRIRPVYLPLFKLVTREHYLEQLRSDRSHMLDAQGRYRAPPPAWPCIGGGGTNLARFIDMTDTADGAVLSLAELRAELQANTG